MDEVKKPLTFSNMSNKTKKQLIEENRVIKKELKWILDQITTIESCVPAYSKALMIRPEMREVAMKLEVLHEYVNHRSLKARKSKEKAKTSMETSPRYHPYSSQAGNQPQTLPPFAFPKMKEALNPIQPGFFASPYADSRGYLLTSQSTQSVPASFNYQWSLQSNLMSGGSFPSLNLNGPATVPCYYDNSPSTSSGFKTPPAPSSTSSISSPIQSLELNDSIPSDI